MAARVGLSMATVARLERAGEGQLASFLQHLTALGRPADLDGVLVAGRMGTWGRGQSSQGPGSANGSFATRATWLTTAVALETAANRSSSQG